MDHYMILVLLLQTIHVSIAQTNGPTSSHDSINSGFSTTTGSIFAALLAIFVLIAFFSVYYNRCMYGRATSHTTIIRPSTTSVATTVLDSDERNNRRGLDQSVIETFPIMEYAAIKALSTIKRPLECAVCLSEFANDDSLRLLPGCYHVFHPDCIDKWLESHVTCPVCRADLTKPSLPSNESSITSVTDVAAEEQITDGHVENQDHKSSMMNGLERFTLRLPDHVRREIEDARRHRRSVSMAGYAFERRESGRSGRLWGFVKSFSFRRRTEAEVGEGSFKRVFPLAEGAGAPASNRSVAFIGSGSGESQSEETHASEMTVLDRV